MFLNKIHLHGFYLYIQRLYVTCSSVLLSSLYSNVIERIGTITFYKPNRPDLPTYSRAFFTSFISQYTSKHKTESVHFFVFFSKKLYKSNNYKTRILLYYFIIPHNKAHLQTFSATIGCLFPIFFRLNSSQNTKKRL